jgi:hypothetical protein
VAFKDEAADVLAEAFLPDSARAALGRATTNLTELPVGPAAQADRLL